jgi:hypothetical protein
MHLLYLDDSGSVVNASDKHIVLAGLSVFERSPHWLAQSMDRIAAEVWPDNPLGLEFRGVDILAGRKQWRGIGKEDRHDAYSNALLALTRVNGVRLFGAAIYKSAVSPEDPMEVAFEQIANRFDRMLGRLHKRGDTQRGLIVLDKTSYETSLQGLSATFRTKGHKWGQLHNLSEVPLFVDSRATRLIQYADLVAHAVRRYYERGDSTYFDLIRRSFDAEGGVLHGLFHYIPVGEECPCPCCLQRPRPGATRARPRRSQPNPKKASPSKRPPLEKPSR